MNHVSICKKKKKEKGENSNSIVYRQLSGALMVASTILAEPSFGQELQDYDYSEGDSDCYRPYAPTQNEILASEIGAALVETYYSDLSGYIACIDTSVDLIRARYDAEIKQLIEDYTAQMNDELTAYSQERESVLAEAQQLIARQGGNLVSRPASPVNPDTD